MKGSHSVRVSSHVVPLGSALGGDALSLAATWKYEAACISRWLLVVAQVAEKIGRAYDAESERQKM